jgi:hypothetical protein
LAKKWTIADVMATGLGHTVSAPVVTSGPEKNESKPNKYRNIKTQVDNITFDSKNEAEFYKLLMAKGFYFDIQVKYRLLESVKIFNDTLRPVSIILDFVVYKDTRKEIVIGYVDTKGMITKDAKIKLMLLKSLLDIQQGRNVFLALPKNKKERLQVIEELDKLSRLS